MKHLRYLLMAALVAMPLVACDEDDDGTTTPTTPVVVTGTVSGTVSIEGTGVAGVSVSLVGATSQTATTGSGGGYSFANVDAGSYGVAIFRHAFRRHVRHRFRHDLHHHAGSDGDGGLQR